MLSLAVRKAIANGAAQSLAQRQGLGARIRIIGAPRPRGKEQRTTLAGLGFTADYYAFENYYDPYYDSYDWNDYYYGGSGYYDFYGGSGLDFAAPPDFTTPGISPYDFDGWELYGDGWYDPSTGVFVDQYGGWYDTWGTGGDVAEPYWSDEYGWTISNPTETGLAPDWDTISATWGQADWNAPDDMFADYVVDDWLDYARNNPLGTPTYDRVYNPPPPRTATKADKLAWLKKLGQQAAKTLGSGGAKPSGSGAAAGGAKPQTASPNAQGECPPGYVKNPATGQCVKVPAQQGARGFDLSGIDPLWLIGGAVLLVLLAKK